MRSARLIALMACLFAAVSGPAHVTAAAVKPGTIAVTLSGLGCATATGADSFNSRSWTWGAKNVVSDSGIGKSEAFALTLTRLSDACSPALLGGVITGRHFATLSLSQYDGTGKLTATVLLNEPTLIDWQVGGNSTSAEAAEQVQVSFGKFTLTDVDSGNKFCYDPTDGRIC